MTKYLGLFVVSLFMIIGCGAAEPAPPSGPPTDMPFVALTNAELTKPFLNKRVHTVGSFALMSPFVPNPRYQSGYVGAQFRAATAGADGITCDPLKATTTQFAAPTAIGAAWAAAKSGQTVFDLVGVLHDDGIFEVESMRELGRCP